MKVVILEDDSRLRRHLGLIIEKQGWQATELQSLEELDTLLRGHHDVDIFILDRLVGKSDSVTSIPRIKAAFPTARILILSSISLPEEKARWLMNGADEYMGKPIFGDELVARLHLLMKRPSNPEPVGIRRVGDLVIDQFKHQVTGRNGRLDLTAKEYGLLLLLAEMPGRVYNRIQIMEHLWQMESTAESNVVESTINHLRRKLEAAKSLITIMSKRHLGYWIEIESPTDAK